MSTRTNAPSVATLFVVAALISGAVATAQPKEDLAQRIRVQGAAIAAESGIVEKTPDETAAAITASKDDSTAKFTLTTDSGFVAAISTPIKKGQPSTSFLTLNGPVEDVGLSLAWKRRFFMGVENVNWSVLGTGLLDLCGALELPQDQACTDDNLRTFLKASRHSEEVINDILLLSNASNPGGRKGSILPRSHFFELGVDLGRTERKYFDLAAQEDTDDRLSHAPRATYGFLMERSQLTFGLSIGRSYKEADKVEHCTPVEGSTALEACKELPLGRAETVRTLPVSVELRIWSSGSAGRRFLRNWAASPKLAYDFDREVLAASLPLYLVRNKDKQFTGGVRLDWEEGKDLTASVFISAPLQTN